MTEAITLSESKRFAALEKTIKEGKKAFIEVGNALGEIRDKKLYRADFGTFDEYCRDKWGWSKSHCNRIIEASGVAVDLAPMGVKIPSERQARELAKIPKEKRAKVLKVAQVHAEANCKPVTAKGIAKAAESVLHPPPASDEPPGLVEWGQPVEVEPEEADYLPSFQSSLKDLIRNIPRAVDLRPYLSALQVEAAFLSNKVNANRNNSAYTS